MLKLMNGEQGEGIINTDDFYIIYKANGLDELVFQLSIYDAGYAQLQEECIVEYEQPYVVKAIDGGSDMAKVKCQLDLDEWRKVVLVSYSNQNVSLEQTVEGIMPEGWVFDDRSGSTISGLIQGNYTPYDVLSACMDTYGVVFRFDVKGKKITAYTLSNFRPNGAFVSRDLNLKEINYKGKSTSFVTRLYAYGKDGLSFAAINEGRPYVENHLYSDKVICSVWEDTQYTDEESLMSAAEEKLAQMAVPERSYECTVQDLKATDPEKYGFQDFSLFQIVRLIDDIKEQTMLYQVVEYWDYPYYPEKNQVTLSSTAPKIQNTVKTLSDALDNQASGFWTIVKNAVDAGAGWVSGKKGGTVQIRQDTDGKPIELLVMDSPSVADAVCLFRFDASGIAVSHEGYKGPWQMIMPVSGEYIAAQEMRMLDTAGNLTLRIQWDGAVMMANDIPLATQSYVADKFVEQEIYEEYQEELTQTMQDFGRQAEEMLKIIENLQERVEALEQTGGM